VWPAERISAPHSGSRALLILLLWLLSNRWPPVDCWGLDVVPVLDSREGFAAGADRNGVKAGWGIAATMAARCLGGVPLLWPRLA